MKKETAVVMLLFISSIFVTEIHQLFRSVSFDVSHWFLIPLKFPLDIEWYVHDLACELQGIIWAMIGVVLSKGKGFKVCGIVFIWLVYSIVDLILYLLWYKIYLYDAVLITTGGALTVLSLISSRK